MLILRSLAFNCAFYINLALWLVAAIPTFFLPRRALVATVRAWAHSNLFLLRVIANIRYEIRGRDTVPPGGLLVACKHQSMWETFALFLAFDDPCFVLKHELMWIPLFGWLAAKAEMVPINRGARSKAMKAMTDRALTEIANGRQIIIFPEGTRRPPGAEPAYKYGVAFLYSELHSPCVPVALNSGIYWPRRQFIRRPGTVIIDILPAIEPGLDREVFITALKDKIETASNALLPL